MRHNISSFARFWLSYNTVALKKYSGRDLNRQNVLVYANARGTEALN